MFTQQISMLCSTEEYEQYLKKPLLKMGYYIGYITTCNSNQVIVNNALGQNNRVSQLSNHVKEDYGRIFLGEFNPELFLALAAMTDEEFGGVGEYWTLTNDHNGVPTNWTIGKLYQASSPINISDAFRDNRNKTNGFSGNPLANLRKATVTEIHNHFNFKTILQMTTTFNTTKSGLKSLHSVACNEWKPIIEKLVTTYQEDIFSDKVIIPLTEVEQMFKAATPSQLVVLKELFPDYKRDKNAFIDEFSSDETRSLSAKLFGDPYAFQISTISTLDINREDLYGRGFYVASEYKVTLIPRGSSTVIEITKK